MWDLKALLKKRDDLQVVCLSDGASELCDMLGEAIVEADFTGMVKRLIAQWHLLEKLGKALSVYKDDPEEAESCLSVSARLINSRVTPPGVCRRTGRDG